MARFDPTQYVHKQQERRRLVAARLHQGLPTVETRSRSSQRARPACSVRSGEAESHGEPPSNISWKGLPIETGWLHRLQME